MFKLVIAALVLIAVPGALLPLCAIAQEATAFKVLEGGWTNNSVRDRVELKIGTFDTAGLPSTFEYLYNQRALQVQATASSDGKEIKLNTEGA